MTGESRNRSDALARQIEREIQAGTLVPGAWLKQIDLETRYGASRLDVRQALNLLMERDLVEHLPNRGHRIKEVNRRELKELLDIRALLECSALGPAAANATEQDLAELERLAKAFEASLTSGTSYDQSLANHGFHQYLIGISANNTLAGIVSELRARESLGLVHRRLTVDLLRKDAADHHSIVERLRARDVESATRILRNHILSGVG